MAKVAGIQMASGPNVAANLTEAARLIAKSVEAGAALVVLPENFAIMPLKDEDRLAVAENEGKGAIQSFLSSQAREHGIWLVGGTIPFISAQPNLVRAVSLVFDNKGQQVGRYDKIHLFDVALENGEKYSESSYFEPGNEVTVIETPLGKLGMAVCYDLRFPELFRKLLDLDAEFVVVPSAFTEMTGLAHWEVLVRARAIENQTYVIAPGQGGYHVNGRETHGDSMIVNPWGIVLDRLERGSGFVIADLDKKKLATIRSSLPSIQHRRL
ncbi:MAG: carbon-nitrogen hydrolase family protein [Acidiferrobacterales bacterium]